MNVKKLGKGLLYAFLFLLLVFIVMVFIPEKEKVKPITPRDSTLYWEMKEGFRIAYTHCKAKGDSLKKPIVFLHGGPGGYVHSSIIKTLRALTEEGHDIYLYDQRGSGLSDRMKRFSDVSFEAHIRDLDEIINRHINAPSVILIGQSFGSILAAHYSAYHSNKVSRIVFASPGGLIPYREQGGAYIDLDSLYPIPDSLSFKKPYDFVKDVNRTALKPKAILATTGALLFDRKFVSDKQMDRILNNLASNFTKGMVCDIDNVLPEEGGGGLYAYLATNQTDVPDVRSYLTNSKIPILVLQGQCDYIPFSYAYEYVDLYPKGRYHFVENAGHEIWWDEKEEYIQIVSDFIKEAP
ncbi:MAG: alpha/beta hydrolase [Chitinophagales bacterium]|nr:alpha/beta hydrolase [Chitinophagales bacterium]